jgi:hypothetical protein
MTTAKELHVWATIVRQWAARIDDVLTAQSGLSFATEMELLAARKEVSERQLV